jgi:hypothetical protein
MPENYSKCPIYKLQAKHYSMVDNNPDLYFVECYRCCRYKIHDYVIEDYLCKK